MSKKYTSVCVDCTLPCLGNTCPYNRVAVYVCDVCGEENVEYRLDDKDICKECAKEILKENFDELTIFEQAIMLNIGLSEINYMR